MSSWKFVLNWVEQEPQDLFCLYYPHCFHTLRFFHLINVWTLRKYICLRQSHIGLASEGSVHFQAMVLLQLLIWLLFLYPPQTLFVGGILFSRCPCVRPSVRASVRPSVTLCFLNNSKSHCWIFIKPCKHVHICKTNTLDKKVWARGQFY